MYCPDCGAQNIPEAKFCRLCGISLQMRQPPPVYQAQPSFERSIRKLFMGVAFLLVAFIGLFATRGFMWWLLFPAIPMISKGVSGIIEARNARGFNYIPPAPAAYNNPLPDRRAFSGEVRARNTGEIAPPSVTENTTKLFEQ